jgi:hypothetical protein
MFPGGGQYPAAINGTGGQLRLLASNDFLLVSIFSENEYERD